MAGRFARVLTQLTAALLVSTAFAQPGSAELVLGLQGAIVADAWNPLRLVVRDLPAVELEVLIDRGSLRGGPVMMRYSVDIPASGGIRVFEDDLFVPAWRSLSWTVRSEDRTIASGTVDSRLRDSRPLTLLISATPGRWLPLLPSDARPLAMAPTALPASAAGYSGVWALLVDGTAAAPRPEALVAAAAAGAVVVLAGQLPDSHAELAALVDDGPLRLAAGWLVPGDAEEAVEALYSVNGYPLEALVAELSSEVGRGQPPGLPRVTVSAALALYAVLVLALLRFGGSAGLPAALVVAMLAAGAGWAVLRPERALIDENRTVVVSAGGIGLSLGAVELRSLPGGAVRVGQPMRPLSLAPYSVGTDSTRLSLGRWQRELLIGRPLLTTPALEVDGGRLLNVGERTLTEVMVIGSGPQAHLAPGAARSIEPVEEGDLPAAYRSLLPHLPAGAVLARDGEKVLVALPESEGES
jgi:hypothetical protein